MQPVRHVNACLPGHGDQDVHGRILPSIHHESAISVHARVPDVGHNSIF